MGGKYEIAATNDCRLGYDVHVFTNSWIKAQICRFKVRRYKYKEYVIRNF